MNSKHPISSGLIAAALLLPALIAKGQTDTNSLNHIRFVPRVAFGISASFKNVGNVSLSPGGRTTPDGKAYNYGDGYVLADVSGNRGGQTWNWGYDSSSQISGNTLLMHQTTASENSSSAASTDLSNPGWGGELIYDRELGSRGRMHYGLESAVSYLNISLSASGSGVGDITQTTDAYAFAPGTTPPAAPSQGTFNGPGFLLGSSPASSSSTVLAGAANIKSSQKLDANIWGLRLGPYLEFPVDDRVELSFSVGFGAVLVDASASWSEIVNLTGGGTMNVSGSGRSSGLLWGGYIGANLSWKLSKHWDAEAGAQYQYLGAYRHTFGGSEVELDFSKSIFVTLGISYSF
jgi:YD repeat-containing protein